MTPHCENAAHEHDATLRERGVIMGIAAEPTQVRNHDGVEVLTKKGPFLQSALPIAGFAIVEAENIEEAIKLVSQTPCAVAQSLVELWPLQTTI